MFQLLEDFGGLDCPVYEPGSALRAVPCREVGMTMIEKLDQRVTKLEEMLQDGGHRVRKRRKRKSK